MKKKDKHNVVVARVGLLRKRYRAECLTCGWKAPNAYRDPVVAGSMRDFHLDITMFDAQRSV